MHARRNAGHYLKTDNDKTSAMEKMSAMELMCVPVRVQLWLGKKGNVIVVICKKAAGVHMRTRARQLSQRRSAGLQHNFELICVDPLHAHAVMRMRAMMQTCLVYDFVSVG